MLCLVYTMFEESNQWVSPDELKRRAFQEKLMVGNDPAFGELPPEMEVPGPGVGLNSVGLRLANQPGAEKLLDGLFVCVGQALEAYTQADPDPVLDIVHAQERLGLDAEAARRLSIVVQGDNLWAAGQKWGRWLLSNIQGAFRNHAPRPNQFHRRVLDYPSESSLGRG
jgi:hypothetical protein